MKGNKGQTLYYFLVFTLILVISWAMMLNIAKLIRDRMIMQNLADNTALSISTHKARTMNFVGACNYLIGFFLRMGTRGEFVQMSTYGTDMVASFPFGDWQQGSNSALSSGVSGLKDVVDFLQKAQEVAMVAHFAYIVISCKDIISKGYIPVIMPLPISIKDFNMDMISNPSAGVIEMAEKHFGLKRNMKGITYKKTENVTAGPVHYVYTKMLGLELKNIFFEQVSNIPGIGSILGLFGDSIDELWDKVMEAFGIDASDYTDAPTYAKKEYSWYIMADNFKDQKMQIALIKRSNDNNKPLFSKWLEISYPDMFAFSASAIYNTKNNDKFKTTGIMFPEKESELLGTLSPAAEVLLVLPTGIQTVILDAQLSDIPVIGWIAAIVVSAYIAVSKVGMVKMSVDGIPDSPINNYVDAKDSGWGAHLVPYRTE
ncbi:MAG: hypothetical protein FWH43_05160 [Endomicrobia bacterium]|nr:hypothetical protein [Endomicrobiia bacterium]